MSVSPSASATPIVVRGLTVSYAEHRVLDGIDLVAQPGRRIGLVGENGAGKSTLLRAVAGALPRTAAVGGSVERPDDLVLLSQEPPFADDHTIADVLAMTLRPLREAVATVERLASRLEEPEAAAAYAQALEYALEHDAWDADRRALLAAERLGIEGLEPGRRVGSLSGGQRTRLAMATVMTRRPHALLLDEPTNHLDDVATDLVDLDPTAFGTDGQGGRRFGGGWSAYEEARRDARRRWEEAYLAQQEEIGRLRAATRIGTGAIAAGRGPRDNDKFIHHFKGQNVDRTLARRKRDATRRLEVAEREQVRKPPAPLRLGTALTTARGGGRVVAVRNLVVAGRLALARLDVDAGRHVLVTGVNGSGKSTLLGVLSGRVPATSGTVEVAARLVAELTQDPVFARPGRSAEATYRDLVGDELADRRPLRELGLLHPRDHGRPVGRLSVGQRRRLSLAVAVAAGPDLLLLDEPTNHISLSLVGELEDAVDASPGTVLVASHDRWLRRRWSGAELRLT